MPIYDQINIPGNYNPALFGPWSPRRIVFLQVPSLHLNRNHKVVICFIPEDWDLPDNFKNRFGFAEPGLQRIVAYGCVADSCKIGVRTCGACSHCIAGLLLLGNYNHQPQNFRSTHKVLHLFDPANIEALNLPLFHP